MTGLWHISVFKALNNNISTIEFSNIMANLLLSFITIIYVMLHGWILYVCQQEV